MLVGVGPIGGYGLTQAVLQTHGVTNCPDKIGRNDHLFFGY